MQECFASLNNISINLTPTDAMQVCDASTTVLDYASDSSESTNEKTLQSLDGIVSDPGGYFVLMSNGDLYHQRTHFNVSSGVSCHACVE